MPYPQSTGRPFINVQEPMSFGQIAGLYTSNPLMNPQQVQSNMFLNAPNGRSFVEDQWNRISEGRFGSAENFFANQQRLAQESAVAQRQSEDVSTAVGHNPDLAMIANRNPGGVLRIARDRARDAMVAKASIASQVREATLGLNRGFAEQQSGASQPGSLAALATPTRATMLASAATRRPAPNVAAPDLHSLLDDQNFRVLMQHDPQAAAAAYQRQTGGDLSADYNAYTRDELFKRRRVLDQMKTLSDEDRKAARHIFQNQKGQRDARGNWIVEQYGQDPNNMGRQVRVMGPANAYQKGLMDAYEESMIPEDERVNQIVGATKAAQFGVLDAALKTHPEAKRYMDARTQELEAKLKRPLNVWEKKDLAAKYGRDTMPPLTIFDQGGGPMDMIQSMIPDPKYDGAWGNLWEGMFGSDPESLLPGLGTPPQMQMPVLPGAAINTGRIRADQPSNFFYNQRY